MHHVVRCVQNPSSTHTRPLFVTVSTRRSSLQQHPRGIAHRKAQLRPAAAPKALTRIQESDLGRPQGLIPIKDTLVNLIYPLTKSGPLSLDDLVSLNFPGGLAETQPLNYKYLLVAM